MIVIVSFLPRSGASGLALYTLELSLANIERFWPAGDVDVIIVDNNAAESGSDQLLRGIVQRNMSATFAATNVRIIANHDAETGRRYIFGALYTLFRELGWAACIPYEYMTLLHHSSALLRPLSFPSAGTADAFEFRPFLYFDLFFDGPRT